MDWCAHRDRPASASHVQDSELPRVFRSMTMGRESRDGG